MLKSIWSEDFILPHEEISYMKFGNLLHGSEKVYGIKGTLFSDWDNNNKLYIVYSFFIKRNYLSAIESYLDLSKKTIEQELLDLGNLSTTPAAISINLTDSKLSLNVTVKIPVLSYMNLRGYSRNVAKFRDILLKKLVFIHRKACLEGIIEGDLGLKLKKDKMLIAGIRKRLEESMEEIQEVTKRKVFKSDADYNYIFTGKAINKPDPVRTTLSEALNIAPF